MEAILKAIKNKKIPIKPEIVISNSPTARGIKIAKKLGVKTEVIVSKGFKGSRWDYDKKIIKILQKYGITQNHRKSFGICKSY